MIHIHQFKERIFSGLAQLPKENTKEKVGCYVDVYKCDDCPAQKEVLWSRLRIHAHKKKNADKDKS